MATRSLPIDKLAPMLWPVVKDIAESLNELALVDKAWLTKLLAKLQQNDMENPLVRFLIDGTIYDEFFNADMIECLQAIRAKGDSYGRRC
jgi:hypothetical protein